LLIVLALWMVGGTAQVQGAVVHRGTAVGCTEGASKRITLRSTDRLPEASGTASVERRGGTTNIKVELDSMKPASLFGGDYSTYVLWVVPPGGRAENRGEITIEDGQASIQTSTPAPTFALLVTAEPHYLVDTPSAFIVLDNKPEPSALPVQLTLLEGVYNFDRSSLSGVKESKGRNYSDVRQAFTAVRLARRAGAATMAAPELAQAQSALDKTLTLLHDRKNRDEIAAQARQTVRLAVDAQRLAQDRAFQGTRAATEGSGGGNGETTERRDPRGIVRHWR
jgi:hypothetical protein